MKTNGLVTPDRYKWLAEELRRVVEEIGTAFIERPVPDWCSRHVNEAWNPLARVQDTVTELTLAISDLDFKVLANEAATRYDVRQSVAAIEICIQELTAVFHAIWSKPLRAELAEARPYFSAIPETILKRSHTLFRNIIDLVSLDREAWKAQDCTAVNIRLDLDVRDEIERLESWLAKMRERRPNSCDSLMAWAAAGFFLGLWVD